MGRACRRVPVGDLSDYRYMKGEWPLTTPGSPRRPLPSEHAGLVLATAKGFSLGQLHLAYGELHFAGVDKWRAANGIIFVVIRSESPSPIQQGRRDQAGDPRRLLKTGRRRRPDSRGQGSTTPVGLSCC